MYELTIKSKPKKKHKFNTIGELTGKFKYPQIMASWFTLDRWYFGEVIGDTCEKPYDNGIVHIKKIK